MTHREKLIPKLTPEFLDTLKEAGKVIGWGVDYVEIKQFIVEIFNLAGKDDPVDLEEYTED